MSGRAGSQRRRRRRLGAAALLLSSLWPAAAAASGSRSPVSSDSAPQLAEARRAQQPPTPDGAIGVEEWQGATALGDFVQFEPERGARASRATEVHLLYDEQALYVAFRVHDEAAPVAQLTRRDDDLLGDDAVGVLLDTHLDRQSGYYFLTNALGTQTDGRIANDGRTDDTNWDASWRVGVQRAAAGWSAELAIPFASLKYRAGDRVSWGVNFLRSRRRNLELSTWAGPLEHRFRISQAGTLTGLETPKPERRLQLIPYAQAVAEQGSRARWRAGGDARVEITSATTAFLTLNPDFALIEADEERVNFATAASSWKRATTPGPSSRCAWATSSVETSTPTSSCGRPALPTS